MGERGIARGLLLLAFFAALTGLQLSAASGAPSPAQSRDEPGGQTRAVWLSVVSLETRLEQSQAALNRFRARVRVIAGRRAEAETMLGIARRSHHIAEQRLAGRLRLLYEQDEIDPLSVVLGAASIGEAIEGLESLDRMAGQDRAYVERARVARSMLIRLTARLAAQEAQARRAEEAARATAAALARARTERLALLARLEAERRRASARASATSAGGQRTRTLAAAAAPGPAPAAPRAPVAGGRTLTVTATGYSLPGRTATGVSVGWGVVAVDPAVIRLGTRMTIPGYGEGVAADTGGAVRGAVIDLWFPTRAEALAWGSRTVTITLH